MQKENGSFWAAMDHLTILLVANEEEYAWVTLMTGLGHLHMNEMKCLFKILGNIVLDLLGENVLGFKSNTPYDYFIRAKDTHK